VPPPATEADPVLAEAKPGPGPAADVAAPKPGQSLTHASDMSSMSHGGLVQTQEGGPFMGGAMRTSAAHKLTSLPKGMIL
jgi:hypothetical protein